MAIHTPANPANLIKLEILLRTILSSICRRTTELIVEWSPEEKMFYVQVDSRDQGRVIGKNGLTFWGIGTILFWAGLCQLAGPVTMRLLDPKGEPNKNKTPFKINPDWNRGRIRDLVTMISDATLKVRGNWELQEGDPSEATLVFKIDKYLQTALTDPDHDLAQAIRITVHAAGMSDGAVIETEIVWI